MAETNKQEITANMRREHSGKPPILPVGRAEKSEGREECRNCEVMRGPHAGGSRDHFMHALRHQSNPCMQFPNINVGKCERVCIFLVQAGRDSTAYTPLQIRYQLPTHFLCVWLLMQLGT